MESVYEFFKKKQAEAKHAAFCRKIDLELLECKRHVLGEKAYKIYKADIEASRIEQLIIAVKLEKMAEAQSRPS